MRSLPIVLLALWLAVACGITSAAVRPVGSVEAAADPASPGVHAVDDGRHSHDPLNLTPARGVPAPLPAAAGGGGRKRQVLGFAPYWTLPQESAWRYDLLTTVAYFGLDVTAGGQIDTSAGNPGWRAWNSQQLVDMVSTAHGAGVRVLLVIKQFDDASIYHILTDPAAGQAAISGTIGQLAAKDLDGVDLDFEGHSDPQYPGIQEAMTRFAGQLAAAVHGWRPGATLTVDTFAGSASWDGGIFNIGNLAPVVDDLFVMGYDMGLNDLCCQAGPNAPLLPYAPYDDTDTVTQYLARAPAGKVILGVPYYGYKWSTRDAAPNSHTTGSPQSDSYTEAMDDIGCVQANHLQVSGPNWDPTAGSHWVAWMSPARNDPCGGDQGSWRELYYEDAASLALKYDLVNARGLAGAGIWALGFDGGRPDLWNELAAKFG